MVHWELEDNEMGAFSANQFKIGGGIDGNIAFACALASNYVQEGEQKAKAYLIAEGMKLGRFRYFDTAETGTQAFVAADTHKIIVAFRGTETKSTDLVGGKSKLWSSNEPAEGAVDTGLRMALDSVLATSGMMDFIKSIMIEDPQLPIYVTGHSFGGAFATLAAFVLRKAHSKTSWVYTFGAPSMGDDAFGAAYDAILKDTTVRYVNDHDLGPSVGAQEDYVHVGHGLRLESHGTIVDTLSSQERAGLTQRMKRTKDDAIEGYSLLEYLITLKHHVNMPSEISSKIAPMKIWDEMPGSHFRFSETQATSLQASHLPPSPVYGHRRDQIETVRDCPPHACLTPDAAGHRTNLFEYSQR
jgi:hypothetical protein